MPKKGAVRYDAGSVVVAVVVGGEGRSDERYVRTSISSLGTPLNMILVSCPALPWTARATSNHTFFFLYICTCVGTLPLITTFFFDDLLPPDDDDERYNYVLAG